MLLCRQRVVLCSLWWKASSGGFFCLTIRIVKEHGKRWWLITQHRKLRVDCSSQVVRLWHYAWPRLILTKKYTLVTQSSWWKVSITIAPVLKIQVHPGAPQDSLPKWVAEEWLDMCSHPSQIAQLVIHHDFHIVYSLLNLPTSHLSCGTKQSLCVSKLEGATQSLVPMMGLWLLILTHSIAKAWLKFEHAHFCRLFPC